MRAVTVVLEGRARGAAQVREHSHQLIRYPLIPLLVTLTLSSGICESLVQRPFVVGEAITVDKFTAVVQRIGLFTTELKQFDGLFVMVPNSELWNQAIVNFTRHATRRLELVVGIGYGDSMDQARRELLALAEADDRVLDDPAPVTFVNSLDDSSVGIGMRVWCKTPDYLGLSWDLTEAAKARFDETDLFIRKDLV